MSDRSVSDLDTVAELLLNLAGPTLFRGNAFRVVGLPAHVPETEIRKQGEKLKFMLRHGGGRAMGPLPLDPAPADDVVNDALHRLNDPELRFIDEFFWFWPQPGAGSKDDALLALADRDIESAIEIWSAEAKRSDDYGRASHNLAVMFHTLALDIEYARQTAAASNQLQTAQYSYWQRGLSQWSEVLTDDDFWNQLNDHVLDLNDPRLTDASTEQLRNVLPLVLLSINAHIISRACTGGARSEAVKYRALTEQSGFAPPLVEEAFGRSARLIRDVISANCQIAQQEADADPAVADESARRLLQQTRPLVAAIDMLLPGIALADEARDEVATAATNCLYSLSEETEKSEVARELLEMIQPYALGLAVQERIDYLRATFLRSAYRTGRS